MAPVWVRAHKAEGRGATAGAIVLAGRKGRPLALPLSKNTDGRRPAADRVRDSHPEGAETAPEPLGAGGGLVRPTGRIEPAGTAGTPKPGLLKFLLKILELLLTLSGLRAI